MASRQFSAGATVKHLKIIQIDQEFLNAEEVERRRKVPRLDRWKGGPAETPYKRVRLLAAAIGLVQPRLKRDAICRRLWLRMKTNNTLPDRFAGKDASPNNSRPWDPDTFDGYLRGLKTNPKEHEEQRVLAELGALLTSRFEEVGRVGDSIDIIFSATYPLPSDYLLALLGSAAEEPDHVFAPGPEYVSVRGKGFESEPVAAWPHPLERTATEIVDSIKRADGAGLALVSGPHMSGKKTCLKFLCRAIDDGLRLDSGERVPYLALALDELEPGEFLDTVLAFYRRGDPAASSLNRDTGLSSAAKIKEIFRIAEHCPACLILADLDPVESDAVLRSLHQDHVSQVLLGLFSGHAATRLVLTGRATSGLAALVREVRRRGIRSKTFELTDRLRVDLDTFAVVKVGVH